MEQNSARRHGSGWVPVVYQASPANVQLAVPLPAWPHLGASTVPVTLFLPPPGPPVQETAWGAAVGRAKARGHAAPVPPVAPGAPVVPSSPAPVLQAFPSPTIQAPPTPRLSASTLGTAPGS